MNTHSVMRSYKSMNYKYQDGGESSVKLEAFMDCLFLFFFFLPSLLYTAF